MDWEPPRIGRGRAPVAPTRIVGVGLGVRGPAVGAGVRPPLPVGPTFSEQETQANADKLQQLAARVAEKIRAKYNALTVAAKREGAARLNEMLANSTGVNPGLTGNESFEAATKKVSTALGASAGAALGTSLGGPLGGAIGGKLGAIAGSYLGEKLGPLIEDAWDEVTGWVEGNILRGGTLTGAGANMLTGGRVSAEQYDAYIAGRKTK